MVRGLDVFREQFAGHADQFVLIGGTAATLATEEAGLEFRATMDLDIVLHIEALSPSFGEVFWRFVEAGGYEIRQASDTGKPVFYRFQKPADERFPAMLELFCRAPEGIRLAEGSHLTPIPIDEAVAVAERTLVWRRYASMGNYLFKPQVLKDLLYEAGRRGDTDCGAHILPRLPESGLKVLAYDFASNEVPGIQRYEDRTYWRDVGTLDALERARADVDGDFPRFDLRNPDWPIRLDLLNAFPLRRGRSTTLHVQSTTLRNVRARDGYAFVEQAHLRLPPSLPAGFRRQ